MTVKHNAPYDLNHVPLHRLKTQAQTNAWFCGRSIQARMADQLAKNYRTGVGVVTNLYELVAYVSPDGGVRNLQPPFQSIKPWDLANKPKPHECACRNFTDPENGGLPWSARNRPNQHHPLCMYDPGSERTYATLMQRGVAPGTEDMRPDEWTRLQQENRQ